MFEAEREGRIVALKVLHQDHALSERETAKFFDEAKRMRRVTHPGIVPVLDSGTLPDGRPFITMPVIAGETVAQRLERGPLPPDEALEYFSLLCDAVTALHEQGLVHRDIKPENVMLDAREGRAVLLDFGIARDETASPTTTTQDGRIRGSPAYMAPERFFGHAASTASDVYELGLLLFLMLTAELPWGSSIDPSNRLNPAVDSHAALPPALVTVLSRALSSRAERRPASIADLKKEVLGAVRKVAAGARVTVNTLRPARKAPGSTQRAAIAVGSLVLLGVAFGVMGYASKARGPATPLAGSLRIPPFPQSTWSASERGPEPIASSARAIDTLRDVRVPSPTSSPRRAPPASKAKASRSKPADLFQDRK